MLDSWNEFLCGKKYKKDVSEFSLNLDAHLRTLHYELKNGTYRHDAYDAFQITDPKPRNIHKSTVRDRIVHHAVYKVLYPYFDTKFIHDSYSCRKNKGTHRAIHRFRQFYLKVSKNDTKQCWVLKCDIRKFFASIDHGILKQILLRHINDIDTMKLLENIIDSFCTKGKQNVGLPLGNLTSQLLVNIYMNTFDQFVKHQLKQKYYIRYADDFVFLANSKRDLEQLLPRVRKFLYQQLRLQLHSDKVFIKTYSSGVDFLGWVHFPHHRVLRTSTKQRMIRNIRDNQKLGLIAPYRDMLSYGNAWKLQKKYLNNIFLNKSFLLNLFDKRTRENA